MICKAVIAKNAITTFFTILLLTYMYIYVIICIWEIKKS